MAKINNITVITLLACSVAVNAFGVSPFQDEAGNPCPPCVTTREFNLVCGDNGRTYANPSVLGCHSKCLKSGIALKHFGPCDTSASDCSCVITYNHFPVCGTNGKTYPNESVLRCDAHCQQSYIQVKHLGKCA